MYLQIDQQPDPYDKLSPDKQRFVDNVTDMGFLRSRVSRAVEKFGMNDKLVSIKT